MKIFEINDIIGGDLILKICIYPGSFDPVTNGHLDIAERASKFFDKIIVAVLVNKNKNPHFSIEERVDFIKCATKHLDNVEVHGFSGLLTDFMKKVGATTIIKGLRAVSDFEYELQMALLNKNQDPNIDTFFMMTNLNYLFLSSSSVKELARFGGNIDGLVPDCIKDKVYSSLCEEKTL